MQLGQTKELLFGMNNILFMGLWLDLIALFVDASPLGYWYIALGTGLISGLLCLAKDLGEM